MNLGLGTTQFGLNYGISNLKGKLPEQEVAAILEMAARKHVQVLDTAPAYGDSESLLGRLLPQNHAFRIVTKTLPIQGTSVTAESVRFLRERFSKSLEALRQATVDTVLVHHVEDLLKTGSEALWEFLAGLKQKGLVKHIGVSIYTGEQIDRCLKLFTPDVIQIPLSVIDQRLIRSGHLARLRAQGIELMARSIFLQGLLLMDADKLGAHFETAAGTFRRLRSQLESAGASPLEGALHFLKSRSEISTALVGVTSAADLRQILDAWSNPKALPFDMADFALDDEAILNPLMWPIGPR